MTKFDSCYYAMFFSRFDRLLIPVVVNGEYRAGADPETVA